MHIRRLFFNKINIKGYDRSIEEVTGVSNISNIEKILKQGRSVSVVTGKIAYKYIKEMADKFTDRFPQFSINVYAIRNDFFGERITVSGLITGQDIIKQLNDKLLGEALLIPENMLRAKTDVFLDDVTLTDIEKSLHISTSIVKSNGRNFIENIIGERFYV